MDCFLFLSTFFELDFLSILIAFVYLLQCCKMCLDSLSNVLKSRNTKLFAAVIYLK